MHSVHHDVLDLVIQNDDLVSTQMNLIIHLCLPDGDLVHVAVGIVQQGQQRPALAKHLDRTNLFVRLLLAIGDDDLTVLIARHITDSQLVVSIERKLEPGSDDGCPVRIVDSEVPRVKPQTALPDHDPFQTNVHMPQREKVAGLEPVGAGAERDGCTQPEQHPDGLQRDRLS